MTHSLKNHPIIDSALVSAQSYREYRDMIDSLLAEGKTTGPTQTEDFINYSELNRTRMTRLDKTTKLLEASQHAMKAITKDQIWLVITEAWCGDAAQVVPVIQKLSEESSHVRTAYVLRDEHEALMDQFLTDGGRSIPKFIILDAATHEVLSHWGPRPEAVQAMVLERKASADPIPYDQFNVEVQKWYAKDKTVSIQEEFLASLP